MATRALAVILLLFTQLASAQVAVGVYNYQNHEWVVEHNSQNKQSIASITKLFTANTVLRQGQPLDERLKVKQTSRHLKRGDRYTRLELIKLMLIASDNVAADTLAHNYPGGYQEFLLDTNRWIQGFGLLNTTITDASGLLPTNQSTVEDLIKVLPNLHNQPLIQHSADPKLLIRGRTVNNTNPHTQTHRLQLSKTGTTNAAGKCLVMMYHDQAIVILGHKTSYERKQEATTLLPLVKN
jgi:D-alanyl-D-alanine endopeptidase (penicillin-binding protein 7)